MPAVTLADRPMPVQPYSYSATQGQSFSPDERSYRQQLFSSSIYPPDDSMPVSLSTSSIYSRSPHDYLSPQVSSPLAMASSQYSSLAPVSDPEGTSAFIPPYISPLSVPFALQQQMNAQRRWGYLASGNQTFPEMWQPNAPMMDENSFGDSQLARESFSSSTSTSAASSPAQESGVCLNREFGGPGYHGGENLHIAGVPGYEPDYQSPQPHLLVTNITDEITKPEHQQQPQTALSDKRQEEFEQEAGWPSFYEQMHQREKDAN